LGDSVSLIVVEEAAHAYDFGPGHPLRPERVLVTYQHIDDLGLADAEPVSKVPGRSSSIEEITAVHDPDFVAAVRAIDDGSAEPGTGLRYGLGTPDDPIFPGMHEAAAAACGASALAAELVVSGRANTAFNPAGGLHHARRAEASGFCIYNDPAVAIARVLALRPDWRVLYLDVDVHHGDGVQWIFYDDPRVTTLSLHQSGRYLYPGTGFEDEIGTGAAEGTSVNVPLPPFTGGGDYLWVLETVLEAVAEALAPDLIVTQLGGDTHHGDPLANLALTMSAYPDMAALIHDTVRRHVGGSRWVATGGGGYQAETIVPKIWTIHFAEMCGRPEAIPDEWLQDAAPDDVARPAGHVIEASVEHVLGRCLPRLSALAR
jgi:acetoin utilization protein AcuC